MTHLLCLSDQTSQSPGEQDDCHSVITGYFGFFISKGQLPGLMKPALCFSSEEIGKFFRQYVCNVVGYAVHGFTAKGLIRLQIETLEGHRWITTYNS